MGVIATGWETMDQLWGMHEARGIFDFGKRTRDLPIYLQEPLALCPLI